MQAKLFWPGDEDRLAMSIGFQDQTVLLLGNYRPTLSIARQLTLQGARVVTVREGCDRGAEVSRYVDDIWDNPPIDGNPATFVRALEAFVAKDKRISVVMPVAEEFVRVIAQNPPQLRDTVTLATMDASLVNACLSKPHMMALAEETGVPIAPYAMAMDVADLKEKARDIGFPIVVRSMVSTKRIGGDKTVTIANSSGLAERFLPWNDEWGGLIVQRQATGRRHNIYFAAKDGEIRRLLHAIIVRTDRPDGSGLAVEGQTVEADGDLVRHTASLLERLNYNGIGCAQFLVDDETGSVCFLEINPRIAGNHAVPEHCGLDLAGFMIAIAQGRESDLGSLPYGRGGVRYSWVAGDIDGLKSALKGRKIGARAAFRWARDIPRTAFSSDLDMMLRWDDPLPGLANLMDVIPIVGHLTRLRHLRLGGTGQPIGKGRAVTGSTPPSSELSKP
jgi:predicted ATP-grasp superfamily ATP-dependent carboligase